MHRVSLTSSEMVHTPGIVAFAIAHYRTDKKYVVNLISQTYGLNTETTKLLLSKKLPYTIECENVVFETESYPYAV